jgi:pyruvate,water dikinase
MAAYYGFNQFELQDADLTNYRVWIGDFVHTWPPDSPLAAWARSGMLHYATAYGAEALSLPGSKGFQWRVVDGLTYVGVIEPKPEEVPEREKLFRERLTPYIENWDEMWNKEVEETTAVLQIFKAFDFERATNMDLYTCWEDFLFLAWHKLWARHFIWMYAAYILFTQFSGICQELLGITSQDPLFRKLLAGFENLVLRFNRELWRLGDRAKELGIDSVFLTTEDGEEVLSKFEQNDAGRKWLGEYREFLKLWGWRCNRTEEWHDNPSWIEKPSLGVPMIRQAITKGGVFAADMEFERLVKEREEAEKKVISQVPTEQKEWFEKLMRCAQRAGVFSEDHNLYYDMSLTALGRHLTKELGRRFAQAGAIDDINDIYFLHPDEIRKAAIAMERANLRPYVKKRREEWEAAHKLEPKPFYGNLEAVGELAMKDPIIGVIAELPVVKPELKADLYGAASAPGVAEGIARIIPDEKHFGDLQPGEILVAITTSSLWTPLFGIANAVVTDAGGNLTHAVIVGREYGIPVVAGTLEGTKKIKTGQRIRVDGNMGAVWILEEKGELNK